MKPKQSMMGALHGFLAGAADAAPRLEARAHLGPSGAQHEPVQPTERAVGRAVSRRPPGEDSLRAAVTPAAAGRLLETCGHFLFLTKDHFI